MLKSIDSQQHLTTKSLSVSNHSLKMWLTDTTEMTLKIVNESDGENILPMLIG